MNFAIAIVIKVNLCIALLVALGNATVVRDTFISSEKILARINVFYIVSRLLFLDQIFL